MILAALLAASAFAGPPSAAPAPDAPTAPTTTAARADEASRLFDRAIAAVGPVERVPCMRATGTIDADGRRSELEVLWSARPPRRVLVRERLADGGLNETGTDGARGWMRLAGREGVREIEPAAVLATCAPLVPALMVMAVADRFPIRACGPEEALEGVPCRRVDLEDRDGVPGAAWFERDTGRLRAFRTQANRAAPTVTTTIEAWIGAGPLTVPSRLVSRSAGAVVRTAFERVQVDPVADGAFRAPLPALPRD